MLSRALPAPFFAGLEWIRALEPQQFRQDTMKSTRKTGQVSDFIHGLGVVILNGGILTPRISCLPRSIRFIKNAKELP